VLAGPILGALVLTLIPELLRFLKGNEPIFTGALIIAIVIFLPHGLLGLFSSLRDNPMVIRVLDRLFPAKVKRRQVDRQSPLGSEAGPPGPEMTASVEEES
jgi:hypothetical protein